MRILTEAEYERRLEQARLKGREEAAERLNKDRMDNDFREDIWRAIRETRQDFDRQIRALVTELKKYGMEDPFEPPKAPCSCEGSCTPVDRLVAG